MRARRPDSSSFGWRSVATIMKVQWYGRGSRPSRSKTETALAGSFGSDGVHLLGLGRLGAAVAAQPLLQPVEIEVDDRRRVEREQLAQRKAAHHRIAERLPQLGAGAGSERERH